MSGRATGLLGDAADLYRSKGRADLLRGAARFTRQRLPVELFPPLLLDPCGEADERIDLHETPSFELRYDGRFPDELPRQLAAAEGRILGAEGSLYAFRDAEVVGRRPVVGVDGRFFPPSWLGVDTAFFIHQEKYLKRNLPLSHALRRRTPGWRPRRVVDTGFLLLGERSLEFPAWHHEVLPKLRWLEEYEALTGESPQLIVSADLSPVHEASLRLMGYDPDECVDPAAGPIHVRKLLVPPHPRRAKGTHLHTTALDWVAGRIRSNVGVDGDGPDRVYVSRRDADRRRVVNDDEVVRALREEGFEWREPGRLGYEEEIRLFAGADVVVGAHGMGLASVFHADDAALLELFPERGATEHYFLTARERGFDYEFLTCEPVLDGRNVRPRDRDVVVDVDELRSRVAGLLADREPVRR